MRITERITAIDARFHDFETHYGLALLSGRVDTKRVSKLLDSIESSQTALMDLVKGKPAWHPTTPERFESLADGLERVARDKGAIICRADALLSLMVERLSGDIQSYWHSAGQQELFGLIRNEPDVAELLRPRGILAWTNDQDKHIRVVNTERLSTHANIYAHVDHRQWQGGRRCRACCIPEIASSRELVPVDPERRRGYTMKNDSFVMQPHVIYAHEQCLPSWHRWLAIAGQYASLAEAEAADVAAGRTPQASPEMPALPAQESPKGDEPQHFNSREQRT